MGKFFLIISFFCVLRMEAQTFPNYIAHAGGAGGIMGECIYSNSKEAIMQSIERGYTFIEVDLDTTSDGFLVASHDWASFHINGGHPEYGDSVFSLQSFKETVICGEFTPITIDELVYIIQDYPSVYIVTDKISDVDLLDRSLSNVRDRVYVEAFSIEDFIRLRDVGYHPMYSRYVVGLASIIVENLINGEARIDFITNSVSDNFKEMARLKCLMPFKIATYTSNSKEFVDEHLGEEIDLIYTDFYNPQTGQFESK